MALMISIKTTDWMQPGMVFRELRELLPDADLRLAADPGDPADVDMLIADGLAAGEANAYPNLQLIQKLGAGVETILGQPDLPKHLRITRLKPDAPAREMTEFAVAYVLREQRHMVFHAAEQAAGRWIKREPREAPETTVGVLGLGHIGGRIARTFAAMDFQVLGYSRRPRDEAGIICLSGRDGFLQVLGRSDYLVSVLPSTPETRDLMNANSFAAMKQGAVIINMGRGNLIVDEALIASLDSGHLGGAVLDVFRREPLPQDHPFWRHPKVTITPHVSGWHLTGAFAEVAENYRRLQEGRPLLNEVDRSAGY